MWKLKYIEKKRNGKSKQNDDILRPIELKKNLKQHISIINIKRIKLVEKRTKNHWMFFFFFEIFKKNK